MLDSVFISYSRVDIEHVQPIVDVLSGAGFTIWIDREEIHPATRFMDEIQPAIAACQAFVFFHSRRSIVSSHCLRELDAAIASNTKLIVIWIDPLDLSSPCPSALDGLTGVAWGGRPLSDVGADVAEAIRTDAQWIKTRKLIAVSARQWEHAGRPADLLLTGRRLEEALDAAGVAPHHGAVLSNVEHEFVAASEDRAQETIETKVRLERSAHIGIARRLLSDNPRDAISELAALENLGNDDEELALLRQGLGWLGFQTAESRIQGDLIAVSPDLRRWALSSRDAYRSLVRIMPMSDADYPSVHPIEQSPPEQIVAMGFDRSGETLWLVGASESFYVAPVDRTQALRPFRPRDRFWRRLHNFVIDMLPGAGWLRERIPCAVQSVSMSPDGRLLAAAHADASVRLFDIKERRHVDTIRVGLSEATLRFSASGAFLLMTGSSAPGSYWRLRRRKITEMWKSMVLIDTSIWQEVDLTSPNWPDRPWLGLTECARLSHDDRWLLRSREDEAYVIDLSSGDYIVVPHADVRYAEFTPDGEGLLTVGADNAVRAWQWRPQPWPSSTDACHPLAAAETQARQVMAVPIPRPVTSFTLIGNGRWAFVGSEDCVRSVYCDLFGNVDEMVALARHVAAGGDVAFP